VATETVGWMNELQKSLAEEEYLESTIDRRRLSRLQDPVARTAAVVVAEPGVSKIHRNLRIFHTRTYLVVRQGQRKPLQSSWSEQLRKLHGNT